MKKSRFAYEAASLVGVIVILALATALNEWLSTGWWLTVLAGGALEVCGFIAGKNS